MTRADQWLSVHAAAQRIGCSRATLYMWIAKGARPDDRPIRARKIADRWVVRREDCAPLIREEKT